MQIVLFDFIDDYELYGIMHACTIIMIITCNKKRMKSIPKEIEREVGIVSESGWWSKTSLHCAHHHSHIINPSSS